VVSGDPSGENLRFLISHRNNQTHRLQSSSKV
jgi:hypothetical protein